MAFTLATIAQKRRAAVLDDPSYPEPLAFTFRPNVYSPAFQARLEAALGDATSVDEAQGLVTDLLLEFVDSWELGDEAESGAPAVVPLDRAHVLPLPLGFKVDLIQAALRGPRQSTTAGGDQTPNPTTPAR